MLLRHQRASDCALDERGNTATWASAPGGGGLLHALSTGCSNTLVLAGAHKVPLVTAPAFHARQHGPGGPSPALPAAELGVAQCHMHAEQAGGVRGGQTAEGPKLPPPLQIRCYRGGTRRLGKLGEAGRTQSASWGPSRPAVPRHCRLAAGSRSPLIAAERALWGLLADSGNIGHSLLGCPRYSPCCIKRLRAGTAQVADRKEHRQFFGSTTIVHNNQEKNSWSWMATTMDRTEPTVASAPQPA